MNKKLLIKILLGILGLALLAYMTVIGFILLGPKTKSYTERIPFESSAWKAHLYDQSTIKQKMVHDLLEKNKNLLGFSINQIEDLLGKPPVTGYFKDFDCVYWLGPEPNFIAIDSEWLGIKFHNGIVVETKLLTD